MGGWVVSRGFLGGCFISGLDDWMVGWLVYKCMLIIGTAEWLDSQFVIGCCQADCKPNPPQPKPRPGLDGSVINVLV